MNVLGESQTSYSLNILDNDDAPVLSFSGKDFNENVGSFDVVFSVSEVSSKDINFDVNTVADTATDGDYSAVSKTLSIPAGSLSVTQSFAIIDDESDENNESFNVVVSNLQNVAAANTSAIFNIIDNDGAPNIIVNDEREIEGGKEFVSSSLPLVIGGQKGLVEESDLLIPNMRGIMSARTKPLVVVEPISQETQAEASSYQLPPAKGSVKLVDKDQVSELVRLLKNEAKVL